MKVSVESAKDHLRIGLTCDATGHHEVIVIHKSMYGKILSEELVDRLHDMNDEVCSNCIYALSYYLNQAANNFSWLRGEFPPNPE